MNMVERIGSGIRRIKDLMKEANLAEPIFSFDGMFIVKLARPKPRAIEGATKGVKRKLAILLTAIAKNERERIPYYSEITGLSTKSIERYIRQLRNANFIDFDGDATQLGGYFLTDKLKGIIK